MTGFLGAIVGYSSTPVPTSIDDTHVPPHHALPVKFNNLILNFANTVGTSSHALHVQVKEAFRKEIASYFWGLFSMERDPSYSKKENKDHVRVYSKLDKWLIKGARHDLQVGSDTHIYRVRKAQKIQRVISNHGLQGQVVVPKKHLYYTNNEWYVVAQKLDLLESNNWLNIPGKVDSRVTAHQAQIVARIAIECCITDLHGGNIVLSKDNKIAFIDTEPLERQLMQPIKKSIWTKLWLVNKNDVKFYLGLQGTSIFKRCLDNQQAIRAVKKVELEYVKKYTLTNVLKVAACFAAFILVSYIPIPAIPTLLRIALSIKISNLAINTLTAWHTILK